MGFVEQYLLKLNTEKQRFRGAVAILVLLSLLVVMAVGWNLRLTGVTMANDASCGIVEHGHTDECPTETTLICGYPEMPSEPENTGEPAHVHTEACWQTVYLCGMTEHIHAVSCYSDSTADVETADIWAATVPLAGGNWAQDLSLVAQSQLGCGESARNFVLTADGQSRNGITRYGQWYGNPHGDWSGMFVMFCLHYANVPQDVIPWSPGVNNMLLLCKDREILAEPDAAAAAEGNILFLDTDANGNADRALIVTAVVDGVMTAISGDWDNTVSMVTLTAEDIRLLGYIHVSALQALNTPEPTPAPTEAPAEPTPEPTPAPTEAPAEPTPEPTPAPTEAPVDPTPEPTPDAAEETAPSDEPTILLDVEFPEEETVMYLMAETVNIDDAMYIWQWQVSEDGNEPWTDIEGAETFYYPLDATEENGNRYYRLQGRRLPQQPTVYAIIREETGVVEDGDTITSGAIMPFSINKNNNVYRVDVIAFPVDAAGNRISNIALRTLSTVSVSNDTKIAVAGLFDESLGTYDSAFFGTRKRNNENDITINADNIRSIWRSSNFVGYYLAYETESGESHNLLNKTDSLKALYLRYNPRYTVTFVSEGFDTVTETVWYGDTPKTTDPGTWSRVGYTLLGWTLNGNEQQLYTFEEILRRPITANTEYRAQWQDRYVTVTYDLGEYADQLHSIPPETIRHGTSLPQLPTPIWKEQVVPMAFDGWYLDAQFTQPVTSEYVFLDDATLYPKWSPREDGYYVYFMDFFREGGTPLVLMTSAVTENRTVSPYTPGNPPEDKAWNGLWYLDEGCTQVYDFGIPVSRMTDYLQGANQRDLLLYPGTKDMCRAIFITGGTNIAPVDIPQGETIQLDQYVPERYGYVFVGWTLKDGTPVSGEYRLDETTTFHAKWTAGYVPFEAILRTENPNDTGMTQSSVLGRWYALSGSQIRVKSTYTGSGDNRTGTHRVVCVLDGVEYPVYTDAALKTAATLSDVYNKYYLYNNTGTQWTDEVNWDDVYTGGELPYSTRPISSAGDTIINFDYMRVRSDITFTIPNNSNGAYIDIYKLYKNGLITGSVTYTGTVPTTEGKNVSATGVSGTNIRWTYTAASSSTGNNYYTLHNIKYGQRIYEDYPVGGSWLTTPGKDFHWYKTGTNALFSSRREDASADFFTGEGRALKATSFTAVFEYQDKIALMYAVECLAGETPDFTKGGINYKVQTQLSEVVNHSDTFSQKDLYGCNKVDSTGSEGSKWYEKTIGNTTFQKLFNETYWPLYDRYEGVDSRGDIDRAYVFCYTRNRVNLQFNFAYDTNGDGNNETQTYSDVPYGASIEDYQFGAADMERHPLLERPGYEFVGWLDTNGFVMEAEDWASTVATGDSDNGIMIFVAKWEKISNNIVEYYEDLSAPTPFETHYFDDGELVPYPTMPAYPEGWVWREYGENPPVRFDWNVPMYGEYGVPEIRVVNGEEVTVNVLRIYGTWDEAHTKVVYDPNPAQGGVPGSAPTDGNEYTIWQSEVSVKSKDTTANMDPNAVFVGWLLDRDGVVYQPGDHVLVRWPRTMIFTAQWAKPAELVHLRYDPNGGSPEGYYPNESGFNYRKNAVASVWDNTGGDGSVWFKRTGYTFLGWNTMPDGSGTAYAPGGNIQLIEPMTTLYAQWQKDSFRFMVKKVDYDDGAPLSGAVFDLYRQSEGAFVPVESRTSGAEGYMEFSEIEIGTLYKLVESRPPNGYISIVSEIYFRLHPLESGHTVQLEFCDEAGNVISIPEGVAEEFTSDGRYLLLTVENMLGFELPSTGGIGTPLCVLIGAILVLAPFVYGFRLRRRQERRAAD